MVNAKVIVLRTIKHGEADLIVHALDSQGAKQCFFARSALRSRKRFGGGVLEATHALQIQYEPVKRESGLARLQEAQLIDGFTGIRQDYDRLQIALEMMNLVDRSSVEGSSDSPQVFNLLGHSLKSLEYVKAPQSLKLMFVVKFLILHGVLASHEALMPLIRLSVREADSLELAPAQWAWAQAHAREALREYIL